MQVDTTVVDKDMEHLQGKVNDLNNREVTQISGTELAGNPKEKVKQMVDLFYSIDISPFMLKEFDSFEEVFIGVMLLKFHLMVQKQKDYGAKNIDTNDLSGLVTRMNDKLERLKNLVGEPGKQIKAIERLLMDLADDARVDELDRFVGDVWNVVNPKNAVEGETVEDTFQDIGNYGDIGYAVLYSAWGKPLRDKL